MSRAYSLSVLALLGTAVAAQVSPRGLSQSGADFVSRDYDYLVVGGGTAGLVVAARLSEDPKVSVGVIEAGQYLAGDPLVETPSSAFGMQGDPKYDWLFKSTPQPNLKDRVLDLARGKMLGGCSGINIMVFDRASKEEYDAWSTLGNSGWNWSGLLPFMKKAERFTGTDPFRINATDPNPKKIFPSQGTSGPVAASYNSWYTDLNIPFFKTMANAGVPFNSNPDSGNPLGSYNSAVSINGTTGKRSYAANTYYAYNAGRPNLFVLTGAQATKVNFSDKKVKGNVVASGVSFVSGSQTFSVKARKEVILSAGSFQSPQLLELSGIGNSTILKQFGIKPLVDLPGVGENLQDHLLIAASYELKPGKLTLDILRNNATYAAAAAAQYAATHDGPIAYSNSIISFVDIGSFVGKTKLDAMTAQLDKEIEGSTPLQSAQYAIQKQWLKQKLGNIEIISNPGYFGPSGPKANTSYFSTILAIQHPFSRGNVHINSADPLAKATVSPQYLSKSFDQDVLVEAMKFLLKLSKTEPLASSIVARQDPPAGVTSDADLLDYIKTNAGSIWHPIGTAALAPKKLGGVVDSNLKVYGTNNIRVIDASVIPLHIATHITRTVYGIAEKAVASIKSGN